MYLLYTYVYRAYLIKLFMFIELPFLGIKWMAEGKEILKNHWHN